MYGSVDNSRNDYIKESKELDNQEQHKLHCGKRPHQKIASAQKIHRLVPRANTISHVCDRIDAGELKGCREGGQTRQFSTRVIEGWLKC